MWAGSVAGSLDATRGEATPSVRRIPLAGCRRSSDDSRAHRLLRFGDASELKRWPARALRSRLRGDHLLARLGGDEFAVLLADGGSAEATDVAGALVEAVRSTATVPGVDRSQLTTSIGVAVFDQCHNRHSGKAIVTQADRAMYNAKHAGRSRYAFATALGHAQTRERPGSSSSRPLVAST